MKSKWLMIIALVLILTLAALSQPTKTLAVTPTNDDFNNALVVSSFPYSDTRDVADATRAADDPFCGGNARQYGTRSLQPQTPI